MYLLKGLTFGLIGTVASSTILSSMQHQEQKFNTSQKADIKNINSFINNLKETANLAKDDTKSLLNTWKRQTSDYDYLEQMFNFHTERINGFDKEVDFCFKDFFESDHIVRQTKFDVTSELIESINNRIDDLNELINHLNEKNRSNLVDTINQKINYLNDRLADLINKKTSLDLESIINWNVFNNRLDQLVIDTENQLKMLQNVNDSNDLRVYKIEQLNKEIHEQDKLLKNIILEFLQPKGQSWGDKNAFVYAKTLYDKVSEKYNKRIATLQEMTNFLNSSNIFGIEDRKQLQKLVNERSNFLKENLVEYEKAFNKIKAEIDKIIDEKNIQEDLKIINKVINAFDKNQNFRENKVLIYQNGKNWKVGEQIDLHDLEIKEPNIQELSLVKITYQISEISTQKNNRYVKIKITVKKGKAIKETSLIVKNFKTKDELIYKELNHILNELKNSYTTIFDNQFISYLPNKTDDEQLGIQTYLHRMDNLTMYNLTYEVVKRNYIQGFVEVKITIEKEGISASKIIKVTGFKSIKPEIDKLKDILKLYNYNNPLGLKYEISISDTWKDVINKIKNKLEDNFTRSFINEIKWESADSNGLDHKINHIDENSGVISKSFYLEVYGFKLSKMTLYFNEIFDQHTKIDIKLDGAMGDERTGPTWDKTHETREKVLIKDFHKKFHSWYEFSNRYKKISLKDFTFTVHSAMNANSHINTEKVGTNGSTDVFDLNEESLGGKPFAIYARGYEYYTSEQRLGIFFELHVNNQDQLIIKFVLDGYSRSTTNSIYLYLSFGTIEFS